MDTSERGKPEVETVEGGDALRSGADEGFVPLAAVRSIEHRSEQELVARSAAFLDSIRQRRTVREFSDRPVPRAVIANAIAAAGSAPSGANQQPWHFAAVSDGAIKRAIREAAEAEERAFYSERAPEDWLEALAPLGTDADKPFLEIAPWLIAIFVQPYAIAPNGERQKHYYATESVGIATGMLITALHEAGLVTLTHTPSPMRFLSEILDRPEHERAFLLLVAGYPAEEAMVPNIQRKSLSEISSFFEG